MTLLLTLLFTIGIGIAMATQTAVNAQLKDHLYHPIQAAFFSFLVGTICLAILMFFHPAQKPSIAQLQHIPVWLWLGGVLGVYNITMSIYAAPKLGFLTFTGLLLFGQITMSIILDHFGLFGLQKTPMNWQRIFGACLIAIGIVFTLQR